MCFGREESLCTHGVVGKEGPAEVAERRWQDRRVQDMALNRVGEEPARKEKTSPGQQSRIVGSTHPPHVMCVPLLGEGHHCSTEFKRRRGQMRIHLVRHLREVPEAKTAPLAKLPQFQISTIQAAA